MLLYALGWPDVMIALIAGLPAIISAIYAHGIKRDIKPPSGGTLGEVAEKAQQSTHANHQLLKAINGDSIRAKYIAQGITELPETDDADESKLGGRE